MLYKNVTMSNLDENPVPVSKDVDEKMPMNTKPDMSMMNTTWHNKIENQKTYHIEKYSQIAEVEVYIKKSSQITQGTT